MGRLYYQMGTSYKIGHLLYKIGTSLQKGSIFNIKWILFFTKMGSYFFLNYKMGLFLNYKRCNKSRALSADERGVYSRNGATEFYFILNVDRKNIQYEIFITVPITKTILCHIGSFTLSENLPNMHSRIFKNHTNYPIE